MRYALLIYGAEATEPIPDEAVAAEMAAYAAFSEHLVAKGAWEGGDALHPTTTATTVRVVDGRTITTDGPFAETKEALGGIYLVQAADLDEAIAFAAMIPGATHGAVEVRPIWEVPSMGSARVAAASGTTS